ncbi:hypothetical protein [Porcincola intestinalis]|uniref:Uncharacterized protein n=1 Tax=Porcincola intestinalis TaxID=2606632 RepID=A0A6L5X1X4_9FIRM|nr:hypothetical protein [Porcincola intestinalis]MSS13467.1 hypothetical protein [Porcincola intestinalis]
MNKEELLLKNYKILSRDISKNRDALISAIQQLMEMDPNLGLRVWEESINDNITSISTDFGKVEFEYKNPGYILVYQYENAICEKNFFANAAETFARNHYLLDILYTKSPVSEYCSAKYVLSYLIRTDHLQEADNILSAIYKNKTYSKYSYLWDCIIDMFQYGDSYNPSAYFSRPLTQPEHIRSFCIAWIERIKDEEEQAGAMTFAMKMF